MSLVRFERRGPVALITLNRPEIRNAFDAPMARALGAAVDEVETDPELLVSVLAATVTEPRPSSARVTTCARSRTSSPGANRQRLRRTPTGDRPYVGSGVQLGELAAGAAATQAAVTALLARDAGAPEVTADVSVFEALVGLLQLPLRYEEIDGHARYPTPLSPVPGSEQAADGWVCVVSVTDPQWQAFKRIAGVPELDDPRYDTLIDHVIMSAEVTAAPHLHRPAHGGRARRDGRRRKGPDRPVGTPDTMTSLPPYRDRGVFVPQASGAGVRPRPPFRSASLPWRAEALVAGGADDELDRPPPRGPRLPSTPPPRGPRLPVHAAATGAQPLAGLRVLELGNSRRDLS